MANKEIYTNELAAFNKKYNLKDYDLEELQGFDNRFRDLGNFLTDGVVGSTPKDQYIDWAAKTLKEVLETNSQFNEKGEYLPSFNLKRFVKDFEKLAKAQYLSTLEEGQQPNRKDYAGASLEDLGKRFSRETKNLNKSLPTLWKERLKTGAMSMEDLQTATFNAVTTMFGHEGDKAEMDGNLTNVVAAYEAMKQLRASRKGVIGWFWKLFNRERNGYEEAYMLQLESHLDSLKEKGYEIDDKSKALTGKTIMGIGLKTAEKAKETQPKEVEKAKEEPANTKEQVNTDEREKIFDDQHPFVENEQTKTAQVVQQPSPKAPTIEPKNN